MHSDTVIKKKDTQEIHNSTVGASLKFFSVIPELGEMVEEEEEERTWSDTDTLGSLIFHFSTA